jgi:YbbR domain-containing protein
MKFKLPAFLTTDWIRKLVALFFAWLIWYFVSLQLQETQTLRDVKVQFKHAPDIIILNEDELPTITVTLRGSRRSLDELTSNNLRVTHRIESDINVVSYQAVLRKQSVEVPPNVRVERIDPDTIIMDVDRRTISNLPVRARFTGQLAPGMARKNVIFVPNSVRVSGPNRMLVELREVITEAIPLDENTRSDFEVDVALENPNPKLFTINPRRVSMAVELSRTTDEKFFAELPVFVINDPRTEYYIAEVLDLPRPRIQAVIEGPKTTMDHLTDASVRAFIDISDSREADTRTLPVQIWINARDCRVRENSIRPASLRVRLAKRTGETLPVLPDLGTSPPAPIQSVSPTP